MTTEQELDDLTTEELREHVENLEEKLVQQIQKDGVSA